jgi:hypothetical protein
MVMIVFWLRGYYVQDSLSWQRPDAYRVFQSTPGNFLFYLNVSNWSAGQHGIRYSKEPPNPHAVDDARISGLILNVNSSDTVVRWERWGFAWWLWRNPYGNSMATLVIPTWSAVALTAFLPIGRVLRRLGRARARRRKQQRGQCEKCGYDLRATPVRCPECGHVPDKAKGAT